MKAGLVGVSEDIEASVVRNSIGAAVEEQRVPVVMRRGRKREETGRMQGTGLLCLRRGLVEPLSERLQERKNFSVFFVQMWSCSINIIRPAV